MRITVELIPRLDDLPDEAAALFAGAPLQSLPGWWRCCIDSALPAGQTPLFALCRSGNRARALLPLLVAGRRLTGLVTPYSCLFQPLLAADTTQDDLRRIGAALGRALRRWPSLRLDALDADWPALPPLLAGLREAGWQSYRFDAFGNWHEPVAGLDFEAYLAGRPGALRETVRRKLRRAGGSASVQPALSLTIARTAADAAAALAVYEAIYRQSWKQPEPFPAFNAALVQWAADAGTLRFGVLRHQGTPIAAQYWVVDCGTATVLKLAHDEAARALSPGTLLTALMIRTLLQEDSLTDLDFGRGDDAYKQSWTSRRRQRIGLMLARPTHPLGLATLLRHQAGRLIRRRK